MRVDTNEEGLMCFSEVYVPIGLKTKEGRTIFICARDKGFEIIADHDIPVVVKVPAKS